MAMRSAGRLDLAMRDVNGRSLRLPNGGAGIVLLVQAGNCPACVQAARNAAAARKAAGRAAGMTVIGVDATTSRNDIATFARAAGEPARYTLDDRQGTIGSTLGVSNIPTAVVYDSHGNIVARSGSRRDQLITELTRATK